MYLVKIPKFIKNLFPNFNWEIDTNKKELFLTFDDGPIPEITPWVLDVLDQYNAKATFFCVGHNVEKHPDIYNEVLNRGHEVGNHTYNHLNGWETDNIKYFHNVRYCNSKVESTLFRPPYGKLMPKQVQFLQRHYDIIMWDVLSGDFDNNISKEDCLENVISKAQQGSIIVFHDNIKAFENLKYALPLVLEHFSALGFTFKAITAEYLKKPVLVSKIA